MSQIQYKQYGKYLSDCQAFVQRHIESISSGTMIIWRPGWKIPFSGDHLVLITQGSTFESTYPYIPTTRFPSRLRDIATALRDAGLMHLFLLASQDKETINVHRADKSNILISKPVNSNQWWKELQKVLKKALRVGISIKNIVFRGGGNTSIPDWFKEWCAANGIQIEILDSGEYDNIYAQGAITVEKLAQ